VTVAIEVGEPIREGVGGAWRYLCGPKRGTVRCCGVKDLVIGR